MSEDLGYQRLKDRLIEFTGLAFYAQRDTLLAELIDGWLAHLGLGNYSANNKFLADGDAGRAEMEMLRNFALAHFHLGLALKRGRQMNLAALGALAEMHLEIPKSQDAQAC
jgi:hypothetical protein